MQKTKALIQAYFDAYNRQDLAGVLKFIHDDIVNDINENGEENGKALFTEFMKRQFRCYTETLRDIVIMVNKNGLRASAEFMVKGTYISTDENRPDAKGQRYRLPAGAFFLIREGQIARLTLYYNLHEWHRQIKLNRRATKKKEPKEPIAQKPEIVKTPAPVVAPIEPPVVTPKNESGALKILHLKGNEIAPYVQDLAGLRLAIFKEYPRMADSTLADEIRALLPYISSPECVMTLILENDRLVGASTGIPLQDHLPAYQKPFIENGIDVKSVFYLGESLLQAGSRRKGLYHHFFYEREAAARKYGATLAAFCVIERPLIDPNRPADYVPLDAFWERLGYERHPELRAYIDMKEFGEKTATPKPFVFWLKKLS